MSDLPPPPGLDAIALSDLCQLMLDGANHWVDLGRPELAVACHQAAALYAQACALAWVNYQPAPPAEPVVLTPLWMPRPKTTADSGKVNLGAGMLRF